MVTIEERNFLIESNRIEDVGGEGFDDSLAAWEYIKKKETLNKRTILHVHKLLMRNLWPEIAGKFRTCNVRVGGRRCPDWKEIECPACGIDPVIKGINSKALRKEDCCQHYHIAFEHLHPFRDGNGRVGRILYNWQRLRLGLTMHVIKNSEKYQYYKWFE